MFFRARMSEMEMMAITKFSDERVHWQTSKTCVSPEFCTADEHQMTRG